MPHRTTISSTISAAVACALLTDAELAAQPTGRAEVRVTVQSAGTALGGADVRVIYGSIPVARRETDDRGQVTLERLPAGPVWIQARRLGHRPDSARLELQDREQHAVSLTLEALPLTLAPVVVVGRSAVSGPMAGFYRRQQTGSGRFFTHEEIVRRNPARLTDLFRSIPGFRVTNRTTSPNSMRVRGSRCAPLVLLDGQALMAGDVDIDAWDPRGFDGIEVYSGPASVPVEFQRNQLSSSSCGTIVLWSRMTEPQAPRRSRQALTPTARIAAMLDSGQAFVRSDVDRPAAPSREALVRPVYPDSLFREAVGGRVVAEFVVDRDGAAIMNTFSAVTTTHGQFVEPVRQAVRQQRFTPAVRRDSLVRQVVQLPFDFVPDSTARRKP